MALCAMRAISRAASRRLPAASAGQRSSGIVTPARFWSATGLGASLAPQLCARSLAYLSKEAADPASDAAKSSATASVPAASDATPAPRKSLFKRPSSAAAAGSAATADSTPTIFDVIIIGAGSGGLALSKEASKLGQTVLVLDYVTPTPQGTKWGLGGTCVRTTPPVAASEASERVRVRRSAHPRRHLSLSLSLPRLQVNVGCIPKKLMHQAALVGEHVREAHEWGWSSTQGADQTGTSAASNGAASPAPLVTRHSWGALVSAVQSHIKSLNFGYRSRLLKDSRITYANMKGKFLTARTVQGTDAQGNTKVFTARKHVVIAVGGRPKYPSIPGARELAITSDDIFSLPRAPGRTLIVGAGYIALETAGFLAGLGVDVSVMARSRFLRGFDHDISEKIVAHMERHGVRFVRDSIPKKLERRTPEGKITVSFAKNAEGGSEQQQTEEYDTVLFAIGREPCTNDLGLDAAGVALDQSNTGMHGKILLDGEGQSSTANPSRDPDETTAPGIFALGDVAKNRPELTPVAIGSAKLLARRLYAPADPPSDAVSAQYRTLDYAATPTTVFTPLEYGCVGWSEEHASRQLHGKFEVYHSHFQPLEWTIPHRDNNACYVKIICTQVDDASLAAIESISDPAARHHAYLRSMRLQRVVGLHFLGPNAGEVLQGFAVAFSKGLTREDLEHAIGIHPTAAEEMLNADITKRSGEDPQKTGC